MVSTKEPMQPIFVPSVVSVISVVKSTPPFNRIAPTRIRSPGRTAEERSSISGVTLLEVLVGLSILLTIIVPLATVLARSGNTVSSRDKLTAVCILEQETLRARLFPADRSGPSRRRIAGAEWLVRRSVSGSPLRTVRVTVERDGRTVASATFYVHDPAGAR